MNFRLSSPQGWKRIVEYVRHLPWVRDDKGIQYRVSIEEMKPNRSVAQNARYWALLTDISQQAPAFMGGEWHSPEVWHRYCATRFLGVEPGPFGSGVPKSTSRLKVGEFMDYMTQVEIWASEQFNGWTFEYREAA